MNKKLVYIFVVLVAGLLAVSACGQQEVGKKTVKDNNKIIDSGEVNFITCDCGNSDGKLVSCNYMNSCQECCQAHRNVA